MVWSNAAVVFKVLFSSPEKTFSHLFHRVKKCVANVRNVVLFTGNKQYSPYSVKQSISPLNSEKSSKGRQRIINLSGLSSNPIPPNVDQRAIPAPLLSMTKKCWLNFDVPVSTAATGLLLAPSHLRL